MDKTISATEFVKFVVQQLVSEPDKVEVHETQDSLGTLIELKVGKDDMGKIIGKSGQTAKSLRILLRVIGAKSNDRINMKILEPTD